MKCSCCVLASALAIALLCHETTFAQSSARSASGEPIAATTAPEEEVNNGQDFTRPVRRFDLRYQYQRPDDGLESSIFTARMDWPIELSKEWKLSTRLDVPLVYGDVPSLDNPNGDYEFGMGSVLGQALLIHPLSKELALAGGAQVLLPTDSQDQFGSGSLRLLPSLAVRYAPEQFPQGWWMALLVRYDFDVWKHDDRESTSDLDIQPVFNVALPDRWFATFAPEFKYSFIEDDWFIPFDVTVGKMITRDIIMSVEYKHELYNEYPQYDWTVEFRIGFFF